MPSMAEKQSAAKLVFTSHDLHVPIMNNKTTVLIVSSFLSAADIPYTSFTFLSSPVGLFCQLCPA